MQPMPKPNPPTPAELDAARAASLKLIEKAKSFIALDQPFFATILYKHALVERLSIPTLAVDPAGTIYYNPLFVAQLTAYQVVFTLCHEVMHYAAGHSLRRQHRDPKKWNHVTDRWINDTLVRARVGDSIEGCVMVPGSADRTEEDMYAELPPDEEGDKDGPGSTGQGEGEPNPDGPGGGDPLQDDIEDGNVSESDKAELDATRKIEVAEAAQVAKMKGNLSGTLAKFAEDTVQSKVPWYDVLERHMVGMTATEQSWRRPNRRYAPDFYLPSQDKAPSMGTVVLQVDVSGSVSKQELRHYNGHMKRIIEQCQPEKVHVIYVDTAVVKHDVFDKPEDTEIAYYSGGGTDMPVGIKYIDSEGLNPDVVVVLTDGYTDFGSAPDFPVIWCISTADKSAPYGTNIHFDINEE